MGNNRDEIRQIARRDAVWYSRRSENQKKRTDQQDQSRWASKEPVELAREKANMTGALAV